MALTGDCKKYMDLLKRWEQLEEDGDEAEELAVQMDALWYSLTAKEMDIINGLDYKED